MRIYKYRVGSNQHKKVRKSHADIYLALLGVGIYAFACIGWSVPKVLHETNESFLRQFQFGQFPSVAFAVEPKIEGVEKDVTNTPNIEQLISYIVRKFQPAGKAVVVKAINCFYSESGLRPDAYNWNPGSNSEDIGVAQVNLKYHPDVTKEEMYQWMKNIDKAYQIYKSRGNFSAWYGKGCN